MSKPPCCLCGQISCNGIDCQYKDEEEPNLTDTERLLWEENQKLKADWRELKERDYIKADNPRLAIMLAIKAAIEGEGR